MAKQETTAGKAIMMLFALIAAGGAAINVVSAVLDGAVWVPSLSEFTVYRVESSEPALFYGILVAFTALAVYFCWDLWSLWRTRRQ